MEAAQVFQEVSGQGFLVEERWVHLLPSTSTLMERASGLSFGAMRPALYPLRGEVGSVSTA